MVNATVYRCFLQGWHHLTNELEAYYNHEDYKRYMIYMYMILYDICVSIFVIDKVYIYSCTKIITIRDANQKG